MQGDMERTTYKTVTHTTTTLYKDSSFTRFFRGWGFRSGRMILGIFILNMGKSIFGPLLFPHHFVKNNEINVPPFNILDDIEMFKLHMICYHLQNITVDFGHVNEKHLSLG
eukprot:TRINITY_DN1555_c0_g1_i5.p1 TRINITY_DN1555_c0_g1~~TRINITY_DN1555_c0_g1_i5.p1  ORF type:complete len:111 (-),score=19.08 TRINITY_DN1555_c0_g1_i5:110-442(-)